MSEAAMPSGGMRGAEPPAVNWWAVDGAGRDLGTGRPPRPPGAATPAAALAAAPEIGWPLQVVSDHGHRLGLTAVLGAGGERVERLLSRLVTPAPRPSWPKVLELAASSPAGRCDLPVAVVSVVDASRAAPRVERAWVAAVAEARSAPRQALLGAGRGEQLEAALHVAMLLGVEHLPVTRDGVDARAASGAQLWLLGGMVTGALAADPGDPFGPWAELLGRGLWPMGPIDGRLVVGDPSGSVGNPTAE